MANRYRDREEPTFVVEDDLMQESSTTQDTTVGQNEGGGDDNDEGKKKGKRTSWARMVLGGEILGSRRFISYIPLIMLILLCAFLMVSNRYAVEDLRKEVVKTQKELDMLSLQQIQLKSRYQQSIKISNIAAMLDSVGVHLVTEPPLTLEK